MENQQNGEYEFVLSNDDSLTIKISFIIDSKGKISYSQAEQKGNL